MEFVLVTVLRQKQTKEKQWRGEERVCGGGVRVFVFQGVCPNSSCICMCPCVLLLCARMCPCTHLCKPLCMCVQVCVCMCCLCVSEPLAHVRAPLCGCKYALISMDLQGLGAREHCGVTVPVCTVARRDCVACWVEHGESG